MQLWNNTGQCMTILINFSYKIDILENSQYSCEFVCYAVKVSSVPGFGTDGP